MAMQGCLSDPNVRFSDQRDYESIATVAVTMADTLIAELNK